MKAYAGLFGWLGGVAILFAFLSFLVQLLSGGGGFLLGELFWSIGNLVVGLVLLGVALFTNVDAFRERMSTGEAKRAGKYGTSAILSAGLMIALLALLAFLSTRYHTHWDWTEAQEHSLSGQTEKVLAGLSQDLELTGVYSPLAALPAKELVDKYAFLSERVKSEFVDPEAQPGRLQQLGIEPERLQGGLLHVKLGAESVDLREISEEALTGAIVKLSRQEQKKVYFVEGHNERPSRGEGAEEATGYAFVAEALANENYQVDTLLLASVAEVPADADVLIVAGPTRPFLEVEHAALEAYVKRGGSLLVMVEPRAQTDLYERLATWGVEVGDDVVIDRIGGLAGSPTTPFASDYGPHPITDELRGYTIYQLARSVQPGAATAGAFQSIVRTGAESWAETDFARMEESGEVQAEEGDTIGPISLAVAGTVQLDDPAPAEGEPAAEPAEPARLVVIGDADFASNQLLGAYLNGDLFVNAVNWLLGDVESISIRPKTGVASRLKLTTEDFLDLRYASLFILPETIAVLGVWAWWRRRRAPGR